MRHPGAYDGGVEYMAERVMKPLIELLLNSYPVTFLPWVTMFEDLQIWLKHIFIAARIA